MPYCFFWHLLSHYFTDSPVRCNCFTFCRSEFRFRYICPLPVPTGFEFILLRPPPPPHLLPGAQWPFFLSSSSWAHSPGPHKASFWPLTEFGLKALQTAPSPGIFPGSFPWLICDFRCQGLRRTFLDHHSQPCPQVTVNIAPFGFLWSPPHFVWLVK